MAKFYSLSRRGILLVGKLPPPVGGVTTHVKRLSERLSADHIQCTVIAPRLSQMLRLAQMPWRSEIVHIHVSNRLVRLIMLLYCRISGVETILTIHGDLGRHKPEGTCLDRIAISQASQVIVLNEGSLRTALNLNKRTSMISAYIPPRDSDILPKDLGDKISKWSPDRFSMVFCTNAYNLAYDRKGREIYGIFELLEIFSQIPDRGLVVSDPSGSYADHLAGNCIRVSPNVLILSGVHDFMQVLDLAHVFLRNTVTDGDSLSVREAIASRKNVIATDVVSRPKGCVVVPFGDRNALKAAILGIDKQFLPVGESSDSYPMIKALYEDVAPLTKMPCP